MSRSVSPASAGPSVRRSAPVRDHVRAIGERDRHLRTLLDEQDRDAAVADPASVSNSVSTTVGARPSEGSSSKQDVGSRDERARDRELLLLPARERAGVAADAKSPTTGKSDFTHATSSASPSLLRRAAKPSRRFSATVSDE